jgi:hypothetical protein
MQEVQVHTLTKTLRAAIAAAAMSAVALGAFAQQPPAAPAQPAAKKKEVKDQIEYDIYNKVLTDKAAADAAKAPAELQTALKSELADLDIWAQKYPESDYKWDRTYLYIQATARLNPAQPAKVVEYGQQLMSQDLKEIFPDKNGPVTILDILYKVATNVPAIPDAGADQIALAKKAAQQLKEQAEAYFVAANKPEKMDDAAWTKAKTDLITGADQSLLSLELMPANQALARKDCAAAEPMYVKALQDRPASGYISYQLAQAMVCLQKQDPTMVPKAIYEFERAAVIDPSLKLNDYADKLYTQVHGSSEGLAQLKEQVKQSPLPPDGFSIKSQAQIDAEKQAEMLKNNPQWAMWDGIKQALTAPDGEQYFADKLKDSGVPKLRGVVVEGKPACRSKEILVAVPVPGQQGNAPAEVTLKLDAALGGKPEPGTEIQWEGIPTAFAKSPFMLTFDQEKAKAEVKTSPCAGPPSQKKSAPAKKK